MRANLRLALPLAVLLAVTTVSGARAHGPLGHPGDGGGDGSGDGSGNGGSDGGSGGGGGSVGGGNGGGAGGGAGGGGPVDCEAARCAAESALDASCPCAASGHGAYVRCVSRTVKALAVAGSLPRQCRGTVVSCAARSSCGKPRAVACRTPVAGGVEQCSVRRSATACARVGGTGVAGSCCDACGSASGAFLEAPAF